LNFESEIGKLPEAETVSSFSTFPNFPIPVSKIKKGSWKGALWKLINLTNYLKVFATTILATNG
jgi:hypothetical protein